MHLVSFAVEIYYDARSYERKISSFLSYRLAQTYY